MEYEYGTYSEYDTEEERQIRILADFHKNLADNQRDMPPEFSEIVDKHYWDLV